MQPLYIYKLLKEFKQQKGSNQALTMLQKETSNAAVMWEPDVSKAIETGKFKKLISTAKTDKLIVDILVANNDIINNNPNKLKVLLNNYFPVLKQYENNHALFNKELQKDNKVSKKDAQQIIDSIDWITLEENASKWFGIRSKYESYPQFQILDAISITFDVLDKYGDIQKDQFNASEAFQLLHSKVIGELNFKQSNGKVVNKTIQWKKLNNYEWENLTPVGSINLDPIEFKPGSLQLDPSSEEDIKHIKGILKRYNKYRIIIKGHTSNKGDPTGNIQLSQERADKLKRLFTHTHKINTNRIQSIGVGPNEPISRDGLSYRAWIKKLRRVEFQLVEEII